MTFNAREIAKFLADGHACADLIKDAFIEDMTEALEAAYAAGPVELKRENTKLRAMIGNNREPCIYCGLSATDQSLCVSGFPGCDRADDQLMCPHFAEAVGAAQAQASAVKAALERAYQIAQSSGHGYQAAERIRALIPAPPAQEDVHAGTGANLVQPESSAPIKARAREK